MKNAMMTPAEAAAKINSGAVLMIAGADALLADLPKGNWIGGTSVYFLTETGGTSLTDKLFVTEFPEATAATIRHIATADLPKIADGYVDGGISLILLPAFSTAHSTFAVDGASYPGLFNQPLMGWITGVPVSEIGKTDPKIYLGQTGTGSTEGAAVMHLTLPAGMKADLDIVNIFTQSDDAALAFEFTTGGFVATDVKVGGKTANLAQYITENDLDTRLPLVANYAGAMINVSIREVDADAGRVVFYAPVVAGIEYRMAKPMPDYGNAFAQATGAGGTGALSCNCILNYLYGELEGKRTGHYTGPVTFGEIAYILLNQTLVKLDLKAA